MAPPSSPPNKPTDPTSSSTNTPIATPSPIPPPVPVETHPNRIRPSGHFHSPDPSRLAPEDALTPPRLQPIASLDGSVVSLPSAAARAAAVASRPTAPDQLRSSVAALRQPPAIPPVAARLEQERRAARAARRRARHQPQVWKKLLWIKHKGYPDNYTDPTTFLEHLQWNPKFRPYEFWPLVADSMVIVQHVAAVIVFVSAYAGIYQDRLSPVAVVLCGTIASVVGWIMWDQWKCEEDSDMEAQFADENNVSIQVDGVASKSTLAAQEDKSSNSSSDVRRPTTMNGHTNNLTNGTSKRDLGLSLSTSNLLAKNAEGQLQSSHVPSLSKASLQSISPIEPLAEHNLFTNSDDGYAPASLMRVFSNKSYTSNASYNYIPQSPTTLPRSVSPRNQARIKTFKSALLIYFALLGLSPILKSLTKSTSSDSIWALATWLLIINIFFFDYGSQYVPTAKSQQLQKEDNVGDSASSRQNGTLHNKPSHASISTTASSVYHNYNRPAAASVASPSAYPSSGIASTKQPLTSPTPAQPSSNAATLPPQNTYPSSLSTNAAVMASTVLASRLPTTTSVFSLTLFSIQIFGLFPLYRRYLRTRSFPMHTALTIILIVMASAGLGLILSQSYTHKYGNCGFCFSWCVHVVVRSTIGITVGSVATAVVMGGCAWWLISLQRYKNVVIGPWDPAKPMLAGGGRPGD